MENTGNYQTLSGSEENCRCSDFLVELKDMKLITLNIWGGKVLEPLMNFFQKHAEDTDIFCLQEVFNNLPDIKSKVQDWGAKEDIYKDIARVLKGFDGHMAPSQDGEESLCMFIKKNFAVQEIRDQFVYRWCNAMEDNDVSTYGINVQYAKFSKDKKDFWFVTYMDTGHQILKEITQQGLNNHKTLKNF